MITPKLLTARPETRSLTWIKKNYLFIFGCIGSSLLCGLFSGCGKRGYTLLAMCGASLIAEHGLWGTGASLVMARGLSSCGSQAPEHRLNS